MGSVRDYQFAWGYTWTKTFLQSKGLLVRAKTRGAHRRKRPRRPLPGMMLHQEGITTVEAASRFIRAVYIPAHNARFAVKAEQEGSAFVAIPGVDLTEILCVQEERQVGNDNTVAFNTLRLQLRRSPLRAHFVHAKVKVRKHHDGGHAVFHGQRCLGRYDGAGVLKEDALKVA